MRPPTPHPALVFAVIFVAIFLLHAPLLQLPYFWDEAGYYIPAARDLFLTGSLIPHSTVSNAHPPLVLAWIALWWKLVGYAPLVTRSAMLVVAAFSLLGLFRLAQRAANTQVAIASTLCTALYPVFFTQSSLAQVDLAAAGLIFWGLCAYLEDRPVAVAIWFSLAALAKETAILAPFALAGWELVRIVVLRFVPADFGQHSALSAAKSGPQASDFGWRSAFSAAISDPVVAAASAAEVTSFRPVRRILPLLIPLLPLTLWYAYHHSRTGYVFGNPEFFRYNVAAALSPLRFLLALGLRLWQTFGYLHLWLLTLAMLLAMLLPPVKDNKESVGMTAPGRLLERAGAPFLARSLREKWGFLTDRNSTAAERPRIPIPVQIIFLVVVNVYVLAMALIGGAVLARYMLPAIPLVIIVAISTLRRRLRYWPAAVAVVAIAFVAAWFWNPPYGFSPEDNLAYRDYIVLHQDAERFLEARYPMARALTAWPASDELTRPWLGYTTRPVQVVRIEDFSLEEILSAADFRQNFEVALVFSTKYEPARPLLDGWKRWTDLKRRFFGYHRDLPPAAAAQILGGRIVFSEERKGQWVAVIEMEKADILSATNHAAKLE
ncbi:MAG TPA: glycosyltransferase family 39 protein [Candidatus Sulfotelmatobacter sp.]|nr:glycosyltransferase family 39 protein [Candidatus Sulfotelmatobacter sp.]